MASSNRHWPSLFKSKPHQWQHEVSSSIVSNGCHRSSSCSSEERTPEPKPRWNPRPEQIRILESIFDSGMVNPPRDEIRKIRAQLQEYGQVGDANVFYWFQNRKSRSKHKLRNSSKQQRHQLAAPSSSSSSSEKKSSPGSDLSKEVGILTEPFLFQGSGFCLPEGLYGGGSVEGGTFLAGEMTNHGGVKKVKTMAVSTPNTTTTTVPVPECPSSSCAAAAAAASSVSVTVPFLPSISTHHPLHDAASRPTTNLFINDIAFEVVADEPFNVRTTFGDEAVLVTASGQAVLTDDWGVTLHPLHPNAFYYLI